MKATEAYKIATTKGYKEELELCLNIIKEEANDGKLKVGVYKPLKGRTIKELMDLGYRVEDQPSIAQQKDNLYYMIYWDEINTQI